MKTTDKWRHRHFPVIVGVACILVFIGFPGVAAAEEGNGWRPTYDLIMLYVNFGILAFVLFKFLKTPLSDFLKGQRMELSREIDNVENQKEALAEKLKETMKELDKSNERFEVLKSRILAQGESQKQRIIDDAREQGRSIMETAKQKIDSQIHNARRKFKMELIDQAIQLAIERLPEKITGDDHEKLVEGYISHTEI